MSKQLLFKQIFAPQVFNNKRKIDLVGKIVDTCTHFLLISTDENWQCKKIAKLVKIGNPIITTLSAQFLSREEISLSFKSAKILVEIEQDFLNPDILCVRY